MALSAFHLATFFTRRYREGANARLKGEPHKSCGGSSEPDATHYFPRP